VKFTCAATAYEWAQGILITFRNGKAFDPNPELFRGGMGGIGLKILIAIDVDHIAGKACCGAKRCPQFDYQCLFQYWLPEPTIVQPARSSTQIQRIEDCIARFDELLRMRGYVE
jgi:hypothetical protein